MTIAFYLAAAIAILCTTRALTHTSAMRALLYLVLSFFSVGVMFYILGAPFAAALEVITYAGAVLVLFVFGVMLNLDPGELAAKRPPWKLSDWIAPVFLALVLLGELIFALRRARSYPRLVVGPRQVGMALFGPYVLGVELSSILLLSGLVGAYHLGRQKRVLERKSERDEAYAREVG